jgi:hypothetical protein
MTARIVRHVRGNVVGYLALFAALGGTSYAAAGLAPGSVTTRALGKGAVTHSKLAANSVGANDVAKHSLTAANFKVGALPNGVNGVNGVNGGTGSSGPAGPPGANGNASIVARARDAGSVTAPSGASTSVPLSGGTWTQGASDLDLITGSMQLGIPSSCTGSFGNALVVSVDGVANTFASAPTSPASTSVTIPFVTSEVMEPGTSTQHTITATLGNSCTKSGEDYTISNVKIDVVGFH